MSTYTLLTIMFLNVLIEFKDFKNPVVYDFSSYPLGAVDFPMQSVGGYPGDDSLGDRCLASVGGRIEIVEGVIVDSGVDYILDLPYVTDKYGFEIIGAGMYEIIFYEDGREVDGFSCLDGTYYFQAADFDSVRHSRLGGDDGFGFAMITIEVPEPVGLLFFAGCLLWLKRKRFLGREI